MEEHGKAMVSQYLYRLPSTSERASYKVSEQHEGLDINILKCILYYVQIFYDFLRFLNGPDPVQHPCGPPPPKFPKRPPTVETGDAG